MNDIKKLLMRRFSERYGEGPTIMAWAPGRVNLIGEHIDYSGGYVFPMAIDKGIYAAASASGTNTITFCSGNLKDEDVFPVHSFRATGHWGDYAKGVVAKLKGKGFPIEGFNAFLLGNLPIGAGVSSSAAMEVAVCYLLQKLFKFSVAPEEAAVLCQQAEHEFAGTKCGIMDQFVSIMGRAGNALLLDCRTLDHEYVPLSLGDHVFVACDSRVEHGLAVSEYNARRAECEQGMEILSRRFDGIRSLCRVTLSQLEECSQMMPDNVFRRCRHAVTEQARVLDAVEAMKKNDLGTLGELINLSHASLRYDYEVSCPELDFLVDTALKIDGVLGARLTGAGFGGSTINLVHRSSIDEFQVKISEAYLEAFDIAPRLFECVPSDGAEHLR